MFLRRIVPSNFLFLLNLLTFLLLILFRTSGTVSISPTDNSSNLPNLSPGAYTAPMGGFLISQLTGNGVRSSTGSPSLSLKTVLTRAVQQFKGRTSSNQWLADVTATITIGGVNGTSNQTSGGSSSGTGSGTTTQTVPIFYSLYIQNTDGTWSPVESVCTGSQVYNPSQNVLQAPVCGPGTYGLFRTSATPVSSASIWFHFVSLSVRLLIAFCPLFLCLCVR